MRGGRGSGKEGGDVGKEGGDGTGIAIRCSRINVEEEEGKIGEKRMEGRGSRKERERRG